MACGLDVSMTAITSAPTGLPPLPREGGFVEQVGGAVVGGEHARVGAARVAHDQVGGDMVGAQFGGEAGAQTVPGVQTGIDPQHGRRCGV